MTDELVEPRMDGDEWETLVGYVDYFRTVLRRKAAGLDDDQLRHRLAPSSLSIGALLKHMTYVEDHWFSHVWSGDEPREPWISADWSTFPDWEMTSAADDSGVDLFTMYDDAVGRARAVIDAAGPESLGSLSQLAIGIERVNMRWILAHMIEEYARHCGHADFIRESIDGAKGD